MRHVADGKQLMRTREYIKVRLSASNDDIRAWLNLVASIVRRRSGNFWQLVKLSPMLSDVQPDAQQQAQSIRHKYGLLRDGELLAFTAEMRTASPSGIVLELRRDEMFPLLAMDLMQLLEAYFPDLSSEVLSERPREGGGAPPLACNVWLEEQMSLLANPEHYHHLYATWLAHYAKLRGYEPVDPRRSFRAAAQSCLRRIRIRMGNAK